MLFLKVTGLLLLLAASLALEIYSTIRYWAAYGGLSLFGKCDAGGQDVNGMVFHFFLGALGLGGLWLGMSLLLDVAG
jgi:hypothetical protein